MKRIAQFIILLVLFSLSIKATPTIEKPKQEHPTAFAIITDEQTYVNCQPAISQYRDAVEQDGLSTYIIYDMWENPMAVRNAISNLYQTCPSLEGIVLVGDIPVAMIRNAQHMTTAFKMDEDKFPIRESSVPSDCFYDDLHLQFRFLKQDESDKALFYYELTEESPQHLHLNFYSARIRYPQSMGGNKYEAISAFLIKAAKAKDEMRNDKLDQVVSFHGSGYNHDCLTVYMDEEKAYHENFPLAFSTGTSFKHLNFRMLNPMKYKLLDEVGRKGIDLFMFHEHGTPTQQLINDPVIGNSSATRYELIKSHLYYLVRSSVEEEKRDKDSLMVALQKQYNLLPAFFDDFDNPAYWEKEKNSGGMSENIEISISDLKNREYNARMVMFDACYNGSFQDSAYVAAYYLFQPGNTLICQGNTRNVLQDRWTIEMVGLLSHGFRVGQYNRLIATLEGHLLGDPTVHFCPITANTLPQEVLLKADDESFWKEQLQSEYADIQCLALRKLSDIDTKKTQSAFFLNQFKESRFNTVRMECFNILARYANTDFTEAVRLALQDPYERIARSAAIYAGRIADSSLIKPLIKAMMEDEDRLRVQYAIKNSIHFFQEGLIVKAIEDYFHTANRIDSKKECEEIIKSIHEDFAIYQEVNNVIFDKESSEKKKMSQIRMIRNNPWTNRVDKFLSYIGNNEHPLALRIAMAEALGWFNNSMCRQDIIRSCNELLNTNLPEKLHAELRQTINRLQSF
ncbi:MAG: HEAT repeat domain-containing protein [Phocaeicola sp.]|uniref:HEAT repeat domain-containing protein n=1 Tax=Phocaeicola sp. TaxID=2773926 RepID=UPI003FA0DA39